MKNKHLVKNNIYKWIIPMLITVGLLSCSDTIEPPEQPQNLILEYKVTNFVNEEDFLYGSINNIENTITVIVPFYLNLGILDPEITVNEGAVLEDEILPVGILEENQTYTVIGANGESRTYTLVIALQTPLSLEITFPFPESREEIFEGYPGSTVAMHGTLNSLDATTLSATLTNVETSEVVEIDLSDSEIRTANNPAILGGYIFDLNLPVSIPEGTYQVEIHFLGNSDIADNLLQVVYRLPLANIGSGMRVTPGETFELTAQFDRVFLGLVEVKVSLFQGSNLIGEYDFEVIESNPTRALLGVSEDMPLGFYKSEWRLTYQNWPDTITQFGNSFTVE